MLELVPGGHRRSGEAVGDRTQPIIHPRARTCWERKKGEDTGAPSCVTAPSLPGTLGSSGVQWRPQRHGALMNTSSSLGSSTQDRSLVSRNGGSLHLICLVYTRTMIVEEEISI